MYPVGTPASIPHKSVDDNGCLVAVESPVYQPIVVHHYGRGSRNLTNEPKLQFATTTPSPSLFSAARGYIKQKFQKVKDHVQERMVMFYLPRAPVPRYPPSTVPTTTRRPTHEPQTMKPVHKAPFKPTCPKPNGLFPHDEDCNRFINCWRGTPHIQRCAPGTLFNQASGECDHAHKVICQSK